MVPGKPRFRNLDDFNNKFENAISSRFARYSEFWFVTVINLIHAVTAYSKLANVLYASELQRKLSTEGSPITVISLHPGSVNTFSRKPELKWISWLVEILIYPFFVHPDVGGYTSAFAAASSDVIQQPEKYKGAYLVPVGTIQKPSEAGSSEELAKELWTTIETFLTDRGI